MLNSEYYLWGAGTYGARIIEFMKEDLTFKAIIDNDIAKQGTMFHGVPVISYTEAKKDIPKTKIVIANALPRDIRSYLINEGLVQNQDFYLVYQFISRYYHAKNKLSIFITNIIATTICNFDCEICQSYLPMAVNRRHYTANNMKSDIDLMFKHVDSVMMLNFTCGESLLNAEAVADVCNHIYEKYAGRYNTVGIVTNGSIIPDDDIMRNFSTSKTVLSISDYPEAKHSRNKLIEKCNKFGVSWLDNVTCIRDNWHNLGDPREISDTPIEKIREKGCWTTGLGLIDGWLYICAAQAWAHIVAGLGKRERGDAFDLRRQVNDDTRDEVYRVVSAQPELGYVSHCKRCNGVMTSR